MVGAGISYPSVPLARDIVESCKEKARGYDRTEEPKEKNSIGVYSHWFQTAYAEPDQRQEYLRGIIEGKPITHANFRLAHLLLNNTISNLVMTTNFDDFLSRALTLFGKSHVVCDHPQTVGRINHAKPMVQIVHLHGSYSFYDCCNLRGELKTRADHAEDTTSTMASLLDLILWNRSPLVLGYSGWDGDVFMQALKRRLARPLGTNIYWFCHRRSVVESLPEQVRYHANVWFVVPSKEHTAPPDPARGTDIAESLLPSERSAENLSVKKDDESVLTAQTVLDTLILDFKVESPELTLDPLGFFARSLLDALPQSESTDAGPDIYTLKNTIERVTRAKQKEDQERTETRIKPATSKLERVRDALRRADYREAVKQATQIETAGLSTKDMEELVDAMWSSANGLGDGSHEELAAYDLIVLVGTKLSSLTSDNFVMSQKVAQAFNNKAFRLDALKQGDEAVALYNEVIGRYGESSNALLQEQVARALYNQAIIFATNNQHETAIARYRQVVERYREIAEPSLRAQVAMALVNLGFTLRGIDRDEEALAIFDDVIRSYGDATDTALRLQVAKALLNKGLVFRKTNRNEDALEAYSEVDRLFRDVQDLSLQVQVGRALVIKGVVLAGLGRPEEAVEVNSEIVRRYGEASQLSFKEYVAMALVNKGVALETLNSEEEAIAAYTQVVQRYHQASEPTLQRQVGNAYNGLGFVSILLAKKYRLEGNETSAARELELAHKSITAALKIDPAEPLRLGNQGYIAFLNGQKDEALKLLTQAIQLGGEKVREGELKDADRNRLPEDDEFCELVKSIKRAA